MRHNSVRPCLAALLAAVAGAWGPPLHAQGVNARGTNRQCRDEPADVLPNYEIRRLPIPPLSPDSTALLRQALHDGCWPTALRIYVRQYQPRLPAWMVYVDSLNNVTQGFTFKGDTAHDFVQGRYIYAIVFTDRPLKKSVESIASIESGRLSARATAAASAAIGDPGNATLQSDIAKAAEADRAAPLARARADSGRQEAARARAAALAVPGTGKTADRRKRLDVIADQADKDVLTFRDAAIAAEKAATDAHVAVVADHASENATAQLADALSLAASKSQVDAQTALDTVDLKFARRTVVYNQDPMLTMLITGLLHAFNVSAPSPTTLADSTVTLRFERLSPNPLDSLEAAYGRFQILENTAVQVSLAPVAGKEFADPPTPSTTKLQHIYANLANARQHTFELGAIAGLTTGQRIPTVGADGSVTSLSAAQQFAPYVSAFISPIWFSVPWRDEYWRRASAGLFVGTNFVSGAFGDQIVGGLALGHLISDAGLDIGTSWQLMPSSKGTLPLTNVRKFRFLSGIDLRF
jgi:hypothetical protein